MPSVKIGAKQNKPENLKRKDRDIKRIVPGPTVGKEIPTFNIKTIPGEFNPSKKEKEKEATKININKDFRKFIDRDIHLRERYHQLRGTAIALFVCAVLSFLVAIADIEYSKRAREVISTKLQCNDTYLMGYSRHCLVLDDPNEFFRDRDHTGEVYQLLEPHDTYFRRWLACSWTFAFNHTIMSIVFKSLISAMTLVSMVCMWRYHDSEMAVLKLKRYIPQESVFWKSPKLKSFLLKSLLLFLHVPPLMDAWIPYELQILVLTRVFLSSVKLLKECNELRYHRLGNVLSNLARIKIHGTFLIKTYFLRYPHYSLMLVYGVVLILFSYVVVLAEYVEGHKVTYMDAWWLMVVTVTNLGSGEVRPQSIISRLTVGTAALIGIVAAALWVNVFSNYMELPEEEKRILSLVEHQRIRRLERNTAAACIQSAWRCYVLTKANNNSSRKNSKLVSSQKSIKKAIWSWSCVRQYCNQVRRTLEQDFSATDTLIVARTMARRMSGSPTIAEIRKSNVNVQSNWDQRLSSPYAMRKPSILEVPKVPMPMSISNAHLGSIIAEEASNTDIADTGLSVGGSSINNEQCGVRHPGRQSDLTSELSRLEHQINIINSNLKQSFHEAQTNLRTIHRSILHIRTTMIHP